ncbi:MAG: metal-sensitive transcriptional regulator [Flavobacteriaceae bacterium]|nr:metal-sensitive transcriptional regulator [Flavobacteriaceae bacterium]
MDIPKNLTRDIKTRLRSIEGQIRGIINMLDENKNPNEVLIQFKAVQKALDKTHYLLLDEVYRKALAIKIVETVNACPGNCGNEERIEYIRRQFPELELDDITHKMTEIMLLKERIDNLKNGDSPT